MSDLPGILAWKFPEAVVHPREGDFRLRDDGDGPYIETWNTAKLGPQPTAKQLARWMKEHAALPPPTAQEKRAARRGGIERMLAAHGLTVTDLRDTIKDEAP